MEGHSNNFEGNNVTDDGVNRPSKLITEMGPWRKTWKALSPFHEGVPDGMLRSDSAELACKLAGTWQVRLSIIIIWLLHCLRFPLRLLGAIVEWFLNFYSFNGGFLGIFFKLMFFQGIIWFPPKDSTSYYSAVGWLDPRLGLLDPSAKFDDFNSKSCADLCIMASKLAYESQAVQKDVLTNQWNMCFQEFYSCWNDRTQSHTTKAFTFSDKPEDAKLVVLAFRGTEPFNANAWCVDFDFSWYEVAPELGRVHIGFLEALGLANRGEEESLARFTDNCAFTKGGSQDQNLPGMMHLPTLTGLVGGHHDDSECPNHNIAAAELPPLVGEHRCLAFDTISRDLGGLLQRHKDAKLVITGHSMGGALAVLFAGLLMFRKSKQMGMEVAADDVLLHRLSAIHTFGQPRVGDGAFARFMNRGMAAWNVQYYRIVYCSDMVPRVPFDDAIFGFKHCGLWCVYYDCFYRKWVMQSAPNKNFFSPLFVSQMWLYSIWEFWQGLILLRMFYGDGFQETIFETIMRLFSFMLPGVSDHCLVNYVNAIRLGPSSLSDVKI